MLTIYTDGGCHNNGDRKGDGSYAFLVPDLDKDYVDVRCEYICGTTNNRMEMLAVINGIKTLCIAHTLDNKNVMIVSDSGYLVDGFTNPSYLDAWIKNGWKTSTNKDVSNKDLWEEFIRLSWHVGINFTHIRGHNKCKDATHAFWNDICDRACTYMINEFKMEGFEVTLRYKFADKSFSVISTLLKDK